MPLGVAQTVVYEKFSITLCDSWLYAVRRCSDSDATSLKSFYVGDSWLYAVRRCSDHQSSCDL